MQDVMNGVNYGTQFGRAAAYFLGTLAPVPDKDDVETYDVLKSIYSIFMEKADYLGFTCTPDQPLGPWEQHKGHEKEVKEIRDAIKIIESFFEMLYQWSLNGIEMEDGLLLAEDTSMPKKRFLLVLREAGMDVVKYHSDASSDSGKDTSNKKYSPESRLILSTTRNCASGMKRLAETAKAGSKYALQNSPENIAFILFSRLVFQPDCNWVIEGYDKGLMAQGRIKKLAAQLEANGYERVDCYADRRVTIDYVKQYGKKPEPLKVSWAEKSHAGITFFYEETRKESFYIGLRMPMFRTVLEAAPSFALPVREFLSGCTKTCDSCRYCVQTDKTGTRPLAAVDVDGAMKCPYFPGYGMRWYQVNSEVLEGMMKLLDAVDSVL